MLETQFQKFIREPLLHFLAAACMLFVVYQFVNAGEDMNSEKDILVTRSDIETYMQYRAKSFDAQHFQILFDQLSPEERNRMVTEYAREEAMYREAKALELDKNDYVAKKRLIQQLEFVTQGVVDAKMPMSEEDLLAYFDKNRDKYAVPAKITFTHVFFSNQRHGPAEAEAMAKKELLVLNQERTPFHEAMRHGDRALFNVNYVQRDMELVASHFGEEMASSVFELEADQQEWRGPFQSPYGSHLVLVTNRSDAHEARLEDIRSQVVIDAQSAFQKERLSEAIDSIVEEYRIHEAQDLAGTAQDSSS